MKKANARAYQTLPGLKDLPARFLGLLVETQEVLELDIRLLAAACGFIDALLKTGPPKHRQQLQREARIWLAEARNYIQWTEWKPAQKRRKHK